MAATPRQAAPAPPGAISRSALNAFLREGPQEFIQRVRVRPAFRQGRFFGWRIIAYQGPGPIAQGDVVCRVNGRELERPEQFMVVWNALAEGHELVVEMVREGRRLTLRYPIID